MILYVKHLLLSSLCLSMTLSAFIISPLIASNNLTSSDEDQGLTCFRKSHNTYKNNTVIDLEETAQAERASQHDKEKQTPGVIIKAKDMQKDETTENVWIPDDLVASFFSNSSFLSIRAGLLVSKQWHRVLTSDDFCNGWGCRFYPSKPEAMRMTPNEFIRYWSTPSVRAVRDNRFKKIKIHAMSLDGAVLVGEAQDKKKHYRRTAIQWTKDKVQALPFLNGGNESYATSVSSDGSTIVGWACDGANNSAKTAIRWTKDGMQALPFLNGGNESYASSISSDGTTIVGYARDSADSSFTAVLWKNNEVQALPALKKWREIPNHTCFHDFALNSDGSIIMGGENDTCDEYKEHAVQWTSEGALSVQALLEERLSISHKWHLRKMSCISANGLQSVGVGSLYEKTCSFIIIFPPEYINSDKHSSFATRILSFFLSFFGNIRLTD